MAETEKKLAEGDSLTVNKSEIVFTTTVQGEAWTSELAKVEKSLLASVKVPGFRPGKAPADKARQYVTKNQVHDRLLSKLVGEMHKRAMATKEIAEARLFAPARPAVQSLDDKGVTLSLTFDLAPAITLKKYKGLNVKVETAKVEKSEIDGEIDRIVSKQAMSVVKDGPLAQGDVAVIDFEGFLDDKPFAGGKASDHELKIGSKSFIPGFEDQLVGLKAGESKDLHIKFPADYHAKDLAGKEVVFKVAVKKVKELQKAVMDDHLVQTFDIPNIKTVADFRKYVEDQLMQQKQLNLDSAANTALLQELDKHIDASLPMSVIHIEEGKLMEEFTRQLKERKLSMEEYLKRENLTAAQLHDRMHADSERNVRLSLALQEIVAKEKLAVTDQEVDAHLQKVSKLYNMPLEEVKKIVTDTTQIKSQLLNEKVFKFLREHAG